MPVAEPDMTRCLGQTLRENGSATVSGSEFASFCNGDWLTGGIRGSANAADVAVWSLKFEGYSNSSPKECEQPDDERPFLFCARSPCRAERLRRRLSLVRKRDAGGGIR